MVNTKRRHRRKQNPMLVVELALVVIIVTVLAVAFAPSPIHDSVSMEAGSQRIPLEQFPKGDREVTLLTDTSGIDLNVPGEHKLRFSYMDKAYSSTLKIVDTTPPTGSPVALTIFDNETREAAEFVTDVQDLTQVTASFSPIPDFTKIGQQTVTVLLTDTSGNVGTVSSQLTVKGDEVFPTFSEMTTLKVNLGQTVSYRKNVTATDNRDGEISFTVDSSKVNLSKAGNYVILYSATDSSGNTTTVERKITVSATTVINEELINEMAQDILKTIITDNMTATQKLDAIFNYVRENVSYTSSSDNEVLKGAYTAMTKKVGDCYNYFSLTKVLLDNCGIENLNVERDSTTSSHYWLLVNIGTGWYHFDTTPQLSKFPFRCFMKTDAEVAAYSKTRTDGKTDYYTFDDSDLPARATEQFSAS